MHCVPQQSVGATVRVQVLVWVTGAVSSSPELSLPHRIIRQEDLPGDLRPWCRTIESLCVSFWVWGQGSSRPPWLSQAVDLLDAHCQESGSLIFIQPFHPGATCTPEPGSLSVPKGDSHIRTWQM